MKLSTKQLRSIIKEAAGHDTSGAVDDFVYMILDHLQMEPYDLVNIVKSNGCNLGDVQTISNDVGERIKKMLPGLIEGAYEHMDEDDE